MPIFLWKYVKALKLEKCYTDYSKVSSLKDKFLNKKSIFFINKIRSLNKARLIISTFPLDAIFKNKKSIAFPNQKYQIHYNTSFM